MPPAVCAVPPGRLGEGRQLAGVEPPLAFSRLRWWSKGTRKTSDSRPLERACAVWYTISASVWPSAGPSTVLRKARTELVRRTAPKPALLSSTSSATAWASVGAAPPVTSAQSSSPWPGKLPSPGGESWLSSRQRQLLLQSGQQAFYLLNDLWASSAQKRPGGRLPPSAAVLTAAEAACLGSLQRHAGLHS